MKSNKIYVGSIALIILVLVIVGFFIYKGYFSGSKMPPRILVSSTEQEVQLRNDIYSSLEKPIDCPEKVFTEALSLKGVFEIFLVGPNHCYLDQRAYEYLDGYLNLRDLGKVLGVESMELATYMTNWFKTKIPYINNLTELVVLSIYVQRMIDAQLLLVTAPIAETFAEMRGELVHAWVVEKNDGLGPTEQLFIALRSHFGELLSSIE